MKKGTNGITLIALVVTIVVLIILATVSVNLIFNEEGIIKKAEQSKNTHLEAQAKEKLSLKLGEYRIEIYEKSINDIDLRDSYLCTKLSELGPTQEATDSNYYEVIVDGYVFWVDRETLEIVSKGKDNTEDATKVTASNMEVKVGQTSSISMTIEPEGASTRNVTYESSDVSVATVSNGTVTGVGVGKATITIITKNEHEERFEFEVTVSEAELESISLDKETLKVVKGRTSEALKVTFNPANTTNKTITWDSSDKTIATVSDGVVTGVAEGTVEITATSANGKTATCNVTVTDGMTIAEAKAAVTSYATLRKYIGTKITDYNPTAGGTWRIFYYDEEGDFGPERKLYLKRDFVSKDTALSSYKGHTPSDDGLEIMKAMNPKWRDYHPNADANEINLANEHCVAWLCDPEIWNDDYKTAAADYAIGSPSIEMYMKAYNLWKTGDKDATNLVCDVNNEYGYSVGTNGICDNFRTSDGTIEEGPDYIFMVTIGSYPCGWLASPSYYDNGNQVSCVWGAGRWRIDTGSTGNKCGLCPVVSL